MADINSEILALLAESLRAADRDRADNAFRFERLTQVMTDGFDRLDRRLGETNDRLDHLTGRVDHLAEEVSELKVDMREVKAEIQETNRRLSNTFDQTGRLTENATATHLKVVQLEQELQAVKSDYSQRIHTLETIVLPKAS